MTERPQILLMENVPQVIAEKNVKDFAKWVEKLESLGYKCYWELLNAKDYGVPQNRNRCFMVSILGNCFYEFPKTIPLTLRLKDVLEKEVDEKYYLSDEKLDKISRWNSFQNPLDNVLGKQDISPTITTRIAISDGGGLNASTLLYSANLETKQNLRKRFKNKRIRYYTPKECLFLMGFSNEDFFNIKRQLKNLNITNQQLEGCIYKQAGNSIVVAVLENIFRQML
jgi:DNA (cytosine-5)-methyltransferase 1